MFRKKGHRRKFDADALFDERYEVTSREEVKPGREFTTEFVSDAPDIIQEELDRLNQWIDEQPHPWVAIFYNEKGEKVV